MPAERLATRLFNRLLDAVFYGLRNAVAHEGRFLWLCLTLAFAGTATAAYPVTAVVIPAALLAPRRWLKLSVYSAIGSAAGATLLVATFHTLGWNQVYAAFPDFAHNATWNEVMRWAEAYGALALFLIAASPLPQTPALIFFGISNPHYTLVFFAMLAGKILKYGFVAWAASRFPERFGDRLRTVLARNGKNGDAPENGNGR